MKILISALHTDSDISGVGNYSINLINELTREYSSTQFYVLVNEHIKKRLLTRSNLFLIEKKTSSNIWPN